jgi:carbamoyltransferase
MLILGINDNGHDAAVSLIDGKNIFFAAHAERYSKVKNDWYLNQEIIDEVFSYGKPDIIAYYEKRWLKNTRLRLFGGLGKASKFNFSDLSLIKEKEFLHHESHAAAGYYTSGFDNAVVVVIDAIGEWNTSSIWVGEGSNLRKIYAFNYPISFGLFYSAFTKLIGLIPGTEEYILMGMAGFGNANRYYKKVNNYFPTFKKQKYNYHTGIRDWDEPITADQDKFDIAAAVQKVYEDRLMEFMNFAKIKTNKKNLVFMGGCALNCSANTKLYDLFDNIWIMPNPGDAGSSLGAAALVNRQHLVWDTAYLGYDIKKNYPEKQIIKSLLDGKVAPVACGKAEFGPRALGNRSIFADPRDPEIKNKVNKIKNREKFRPFAPVILEEYAQDWFEMPTSASPYMQFAFKCKKPDLIPSVVHIDGTSRVQTVNHKQNPGLYSTLKTWHQITGVPVLLNTSLNIRNQPLINDPDQVNEWNNNNPGFDIH